LAAGTLIGIDVVDHVVLGDARATAASKGGQATVEPGSVLRLFFRDLGRHDARRAARRPACRLDDLKAALGKPGARRRRAACGQGAAHRRLGDESFSVIERPAPSSQAPGLMPTGICRRSSRWSTKSALAPRGPREPRQGHVSSGSARPKRRSTRCRSKKVHLPRGRSARFDHRHCRHGGSRWKWGGCRTASSARR